MVSTPHGDGVENGVTVPLDKPWRVQPAHPRNNGRTWEVCLYQRQIRLGEMRRTFSLVKYQAVASLEVCILLLPLAQ